MNEHKVPEHKTPGVEKADVERKDKEKADKAEAERKLRETKAELDATFRVDKGTEEVKDKDGNVTTQGVEGDSKQNAELKDAYKAIAYSIVERVPESRERFFAIDTLTQSLNWATEALKRK